MYGNPNSFHRAGGSRGKPPTQPTAQHLNTNLNPPNPNILLQNPAFPPLQNLNLPLQNPNFPLLNPHFNLQHPNFSIHNPNFHIQNPNLAPQQLLNLDFQPQSLELKHENFPVQNPNFLIQNTNVAPQKFLNSGFQSHGLELKHQGRSFPQNHKETQAQNVSQKPNQLLEKIEGAVGKARHDLLAAGENVSAWKVSQAALLTLQVETWSSLGFQMQEVPALNRLIVTEGKVNAFIHCFVGVRRITSLYDLEVAICKNECIEQFKELELGPLLRHPLIIHYFASHSDVNEVFKITSEEIISYLCNFMDTRRNNDVTVEDFLDFIAKKRSVKGREKLGVRIQSLGMHISLIREARRSEDTISRKSVEALKQRCDEKRKKRRPFSSQKMHLGERFSTISQRVKSFSSVHEDFRNNHVRVVSSSSEDEDSDGCTDEDKKNNNDVSHVKSQLQSIKSFDRVSSCPYPSAIEEMTRLGMKDEVDDRSSQKKHLDKCFSAISHIKSFSSVHKDFGNKHIRFVSSSSEDEDSDECKNEDKKNDNDAHNHFMSRLQNIKTNDRVSSCPYPSAVEEMTRLGLKGSEMDVCPPAGGSSSYNEHHVSVRKKRKFENHSCTISAPHKLLRRDKVEQDTLQMGNGSETKECSNLNEADLLVSDKSIRMFITTWKEACREHTISEVLERMLQFYNATARRRKRINSVFSSYPFVGLLNVAVTSIKTGMWDSIYDTFQAISQHELTSTFSDKNSEYERIDIELGEKDAPIISEHIVEGTHSVTVEDVIGKVASYFEHEHEIQGDGKSLSEKKRIFLRKLCNCEFWLAQQFSIKEFKCLGYGEIFVFLEKHVSLLPNQLQEFLTGTMSEKFPLEVCMLQHQLVVLVSQASNCLKGNEVITKQVISELLIRQFPLLSFKMTENGSLEDFLDIVGDQKNNIISKCVQFSAALLGPSYNGKSLVCNENDLLNTVSVSTDVGQKAIEHTSVTTKDAIKVLVRAPMLSDLYSWSHWDNIFAPALGPLVEFLLCEVNTKELLCVVTKDGRVVRIDHSATPDSFLEAVLQGSSFRTAVKLLSLLTLVGGEKQVPLSLLKCHARRAFEVILKNSLENMEVNDNALMYGKSLCWQKMLNEVASDNLNSGLHKYSSKMDKAVPVASRFFLDCLGYLPSEFRGFAADILLSGLRFVIKDAHSAILHECNKIEQRLMVQEVGLSLGIVEWIDDYQAFCSGATTDLFMPLGVSCLKAVQSELSTGSCYNQDALDKFSSSEGEMIASLGVNGRGDEFSEVCCTADGAEVFGDGTGNGCRERLSEPSKHKNAAIVIESIRQDEFGLGPYLSNMESSMLKKQHARLGRALHCLSQELYSQDSHFILELVQNADDNIYPENVEPTLTFILQGSGIIVLNNEQGFSSQNIRALCDVGNSTKKGSSAGYIGQKGIGFKSVFRVTDAPEIHSNGFHIKFDISEGQIGFVLPTVIPPCDIDYLSRLAFSDTDQLDNKCWNTCIVLPFRSKLAEETAMNSIITMFSDLHPSLLLFLHRLQCIRFRNVINGSLIVMRKEIVGNGIIKVSRGKEKMTWFVASQKLWADAIRREVQTTEIAIALTLQESDKGDYNPHLEQQPVFAFLPLRTYGLKFILQGDFILPSSREEVDGDSPWNQWLLSEFPGLFVNAEKSFCGLPCFRENPGKAVATYMSFVPLVGEVHGFFSSLPRMIISKLRMSNCLFLEGDSKEWVPPCKAIRGWNDQARILLPEGLLREHFGLGFLDKDIVLSDPLARALGIEEYGPKILLQVISSLCHTDNGLKSMGLGWLSSWLNALYTMSFHSSGKMSLNSGLEKDLIKDLQKIPFIPLSDGTYSSVDKGTIWMHSETLSTRLDGEQGLEAFPNLYAKLCTVNPALFTSSAVDTSCLDVTLVNNLTGMLHRIGVQQLSAHEILKLHILPTMSADIIRDKNLMIEYICFVMIHLQSSCPNCRVEREFIISELQNKAFILTNYGFKRPVEVPIHFSKDFGNTVNVSRLVDAVDMKWHEVDIAYLKHPVTKALPGGLMKWREFFQEIGVTDFVKIIQVDKSVADISHTMFKNMMWDRNLISLGSIAKDWESLELSQLLSLLSTNGKHESCKYLLEVLDILWDECFSEKATGYCNSVVIGHNEPFKSSLISTIWDVPWVVSSMDDRLHYSKDLFYDCDAVRSVLGASAPYAVPKIRSGKLLSDIGFKTKVTLDDILGILKVWRRSGTSFKASIAQMSKLYTFIWNEMAASKQKIGQEFLSGPFIFVPYASESRHEDLVPGVFFSPQDVCWHDSTGSVDQMKDIHPQCSSTGQTYRPLSKTLCNIYPGLHDFFVNECGIHEIPPLCSYLHILLQLSTAALPSQAANSVFQIFLKWTDGLKSGLMSSEDIAYLKESLMKPEFTVLPTVQDKWVSLHPSFGLACWSDDEKLRKEFKHLDSIDYLYFGELSNNEKEMLQTKVSTLMQTIGIPALSKLVTREAIYDGPTDCRFKASLVNWALPFTQRYIYRVHPDKYIQLKQSGCDDLNGLQVVVVEKLFYRNIIKSCGIASTKRFDCSSLLQGNILYTTRESDSHALFMELSRLFFDGTPELHLANFLHMITTMAESGSTEEQTEFFILNSQKVPKLPDEESVWSLSCVPSLAENVESLLVSSASTKINEQSSSKPKKNAGSNPNWPPVDWKTAPDFTYARENGFKTQAAVAQPSSSSQKKDDNSVGIVDWTIEGDSAATSTTLVLPESKILNDHFGHAYSRADSSMDIVFDPVVYDSPELGVSNFSKRDQLNIGTPNAAQAILTGRLGELIAFKYFTEKVGNSVVKWVNEHNETGLPYDIVIGEENCREYIEVKATKSARKDWFIISMREWQFAVDKGDLFSVAHVVLLGNNTARVSIFKNPVKLCQLGKLQLVVMMPRERKEFSIVS